jgi:hypothetical protein
MNPQDLDLEQLLRRLHLPTVRRLYGLSEKICHTTSKEYTADQLRIFGHPE